MAQSPLITTKKVKSNEIITQINRPHQGGEGTSEGNFVPMILSLSPERTLGTRLASLSSPKLKQSFREEMVVRFYGQITRIPVKTVNIELHSSTDWINLSAQFMRGFYK